MTEDAVKRFEQWICEHYSYLLRVAAKWLWSNDDAQDVVQDVVVILLEEPIFRKFNAMDERARSEYVARAVRNRAFDYFRRQKYRPSLSEATAAAACSHAPSPEAEAIIEEFMNAAGQQVDPGAIAVMRDGFTDKEAAEALQCSTKTIQRMRARLRELRAHSF